MFNITFNPLTQSSQGEVGLGRLLVNVCVCSSLSAWDQDSTSISKADPK